MDDDDAGNSNSDEIRALEEVLNAFFYYGNFGKEKILRMIDQMRKIPHEHQLLIGEPYKEHISNLKMRMEHNHSILKMIANYGAGMFGDDHNSALRMHQSRRPTADFLSKVLSTMRQICREWSSEGLPEREATFRPIIEELNRIFPKSAGNRHEIRVLVPGCGLGRLAHDLIDEGFSVEGNEFSYFMLIASCFILNACKQPNQFTIYPFIFDKSNCWKYEDQLRAVTFPDKSPASSLNQTVRLNAFSMCAGDFLEIIKNRQLDAICTAWFIDTAHNIVEYIVKVHAENP
uniref:carnosine N-methyltransferase n=1 Tax=Caenorhabditis japonica TaxID=281687 RepID=A0A8R1HT56_CAEJA